MRVAAGIFRFWQGGKRGANACKALALDCNAAKSKKGRCPKGFRPNVSDAALSALRIAIPWIPRNAHALRQMHLDENDAYSDLLDTL